jgi:hypothetical protein
MNTSGSLGSLNRPTFSMTDVLFTNNNGNYGGAIYYDLTNLDIYNSTFDGNTALKDAGGIYVIQTSDYASLSTDSDVIFKNNIALNGPTRPVDNADSLYPTIKYASTSVSFHPLNNYDINFIGNELTYKVTFTLNVEGLDASSSYLPIPLEYTITQHGYTLTSEIPIINNWLKDYLELVPFTGDYHDSHDFSGWLSNHDSIDSPILRDTDFVGTLTLKRFNVVFVCPQVGLYGETIRVPYGSSLLEPRIDPSEYQLPDGYRHIGWHLGGFLSKEEALKSMDTMRADGISGATTSIQMPGQDPTGTRPDLAARVIIETLDGYNITITENKRRMDYTFSNNVINNVPVENVDLNNVTLFNFSGSEDTGKVANEYDVITQDKVLTRINAYSAPSSPTSPTAPPVGETPNQDLTNTGLNMYMIILSIGALSLTLALIRKYDL